MDGTPRLRGAFPATPHTNRQFGLSTSAMRKRLSDQPLPNIPALRSPSSTAASDKPVIPEDIIDAPSQRLYAVCVLIALWSWKVWDYLNLQDTGEQSLWMFMKWVLLDGSYLFFLPSLRIPWLEWSPSTMTLLFCAHAFADGMMMFNIPIPLGAGVAAVGRSVWGAYEMAVAERNVNPSSIRFNDSLILGRQVINILPEGSAILNADKEPFCLSDARPEARLPITINSTNPISMELLRIDLDTEANETIIINKAQIKTMHREASRMVSYSEKLNEPKTLYYSVKKPGLYLLAKVMDETKLEVVRKRLAHTAVVPCPKAAVLPSSSDKCRGELSNVALEVTGTPPLKLTYRKMINSQMTEATFEAIQPDDFVSPLAQTEQNSLSVPNHVDTFWAKPHKIRVPLNESLNSGGKWVYSIEEVADGLGNVVSFTERDHERQERHRAKSSNLHQVIAVHERPTATLQGCDAQHPLKVAKGNAANFPVRFGSSGRSELTNTAFHIEYLFSSPDDILTTGEHSNTAQRKKVTLKNHQQQPTIQEPGLYTLTGVSSDFCGGDILEPASCVLQNPPEPQLSITAEKIIDKCAGSPIGLRVDLDLVGTPPFIVHYRMSREGDRHHTTKEEKINGLRGQLELTPKHAGKYLYEFTEISDAVYRRRPVQDSKLEQEVKPAASANIMNAQQKRASCIDDPVTLDVALQGEGPFNLEYELVHSGKRSKRSIPKIEGDKVTITTDPLRNGGEYTVTLLSVTDGAGCKEFLKDEAKISVRHQRPKAGFGNIDGGRKISTLEHEQVHLPLRLVGEAPWSIKYRDANGNEHAKKVQHQNDKITVTQAGKYELLDVEDVSCPGVVDDTVKDFEVSWIEKPSVRVAPADALQDKDHAIVKREVCEGDDDGLELLFKGTPPFHLQYVETIKPQHGAIAPKTKDLKAAMNVASLRMDTVLAGAYEYKFSKLADANYDQSSKGTAPLVVRQYVNARPSVAFNSPGKTYSYCEVESEGEEVIPITLRGAPPFEVEFEIKHHGTIKPETVSIHSIAGHSHDIVIPHARVKLGKSAVQLRRISDSRGCSRLLDSSTPRVQLSVHTAPSISPVENKNDYCVGERLNFVLSGVAPFHVTYTFEGKELKATVSGTTFTRLAEKPGTFTVVGVRDSASQCTQTVEISKRIHGMPWVRVSKGDEGYIDIHEGSQAEISFDFGGAPPFEFTYTRSSNTEKNGRKGVLLDMKSEVSEGYATKVSASEEGTYEVVAIKDRYCAYTKPGTKVDGKSQKLLTY